MSKFNFDFKVKVVTEYLSGQAAFSLKVNPQDWTEKIQSWGFRYE
ncbi:hypothetical protein [Loigolactobacillus backii]|nr:hypothetical protein [Loigolactobacillus backii]